MATEGDLRAPTVGTWLPRVVTGASVVPGVVIGTLIRAGTALDVVAPDGVGGAAVDIAIAGAWVDHGTLLLRIGEASVARGTEKAVDSDVPAYVTVVRADSDGTIYLSPEPSAPVFAVIGANVAQRGTLALIEVMKTFNPVRSPIVGIVERVLVTTGSAVAQGQPLFWVK